MVLTGLLSFAVSGLVNRLLIAWAGKKRFRGGNAIVPQHQASTPPWGGLGIAAGLFTAFPYWPREEWPFFAGAVWFLLLGFADDLIAFRPLTKFMLQVLGASAAMFAFGGAGIWKFGFVLWAVSVVNAINLTDVCDGLVGTISVCVAATLCVLNPPLQPFLFALIASLAGFLVWNRPNARIYMGDGGAHLIGYLFAFVIWRQAQHGFDGLLWGVIALWVFFFEILLITIARIRKGLPWWRGSPDHFSLRLQAAGWSKWSVLGIAVVASGATIPLAAFARPFAGPILALFIGVGLILGERLYRLTA
ncbi:MAG: glycosyltransferase family 4 protein [Fimbriimonas sp.]